MNKKLKVLSLFSGCGGLDLGFENAGYQIVAAIDNWQEALNTLQRNFPKTEALNIDLGNFHKKEFNIYEGTIDVVIGGPPCQGFSISGKRDIDDPRNKLYEGFLKVVKHVNPKAFVMENVPNLISMGKGEILKKILNDFTRLGYQVEYRVLTASNFGVPQNRKRVFIVGVKGSKYKFPKEIYDEKNRLTCLDAIGDLSEHGLVDGSAYGIAPRSDYQSQMRLGSIGIFNHQITNHDVKTIEIIKLVPDGGNYKNLPEHLQQTRKVNIAWTRYSSKKPSLTIDTGHRHHFHYKFNRVPTVRESARLQSFPDRFVFLGSKTSQYKQVGNAVPPILGEAIARELKKYV